MDIMTLQGEAHMFSGDLLVVGRFQGDEASAVEATIDQTLNGALSRRATKHAFKGKSGQCLTLDTAGLIPADRVMLLGLGEEAKWSGLTARNCAGDAAREALSARASAVGIVLTDSVTQDQTTEVILGFELGLYRFDQHQTPDADSPRHEVEKLVLNSDCRAKDIARAVTLAKAVNTARTLVNEPPNICTPTRLAHLAEELNSDQVSVKVLGREAIEAHGMGGVIAVSQGATAEPKFIHIHYRPSGEAQGSLALIGKGLTFDSGGLSLKPPKAQETMHVDMGGAAAVLGAMIAICELQPDIEVHGIVGSCENMPDGNSYRPSDILTMYNKKTVEVLNTDAEGRLVLADALHYATELKPDAMVNLATLTGACIVGLGNNYCGLFSDDDHWADELLAAAKDSGEKLWRLPLDEGLASSLKSKRADVRNIGGPWGGAITAALFLKHFKGDRRWAHLDIAGPTTADRARGSISAGATGFGVLTLVALAERFHHFNAHSKDSVEEPNP